MKNMVHRNHLVVLKSTDAISQLDSKGNLKHLLTIEGLSKSVIFKIFELADNFIQGNQIKNATHLQGVNVANLFFEPSTRTRITFEIAEKSLMASVTNFDIKSSSAIKGESLIDTLKNLEMMGIKIFVVRHSSNGAAHYFAQHADNHCSIINAGDGSHAHPTQALLDIATLRRHRPDFENLKVAIVGDLLHSRVCRSQIHALKIIGVPEINVIAPRTLSSAHIESLGVKYFDNLDKGLDSVDVIFCLRLQKERMQKALIPSKKEYFEQYGIDKTRLKIASKDVLVMHPGPINRGVELATDVVDGLHSLILNQVTEGIAVRMAILQMIHQGRQV